MTIRYYHDDYNTKHATTHYGINSIRAIFYNLHVLEGFLTPSRIVTEFNRVEVIVLE